MLCGACFSTSQRQVVEVLHHVEPEKRDAMLAGIPEEAARQLKALLEYPEDTAGGMMDPQVVSIPIDVTVQEAIMLLRKAPRQRCWSAATSMSSC